MIESEGEAPSFPPFSLNFHPSSCLFSFSLSFGPACLEAAKLSASRGDRQAGNKGNFLLLT